MTRPAAWMGTDGPLDSETALALRAAYFLIDAANRAVDSHQLVVHSYSALEGLLTSYGSQTPEL
jgi:hypothetical protein